MNNSSKKPDNRPADASRNDVDVSSLLSKLNSPEDITEDTSYYDVPAEDAAYRAQLREMIEKLEQSGDPQTAGTDGEPAADTGSAAEESAGPSGDAAPAQPAPEDLYQLLFDTEAIPEEPEEEETAEETAAPAAPEEKIDEDEEFDSNYYSPDLEKEAERQKAAEAASREIPAAPEADDAEDGSAADDADEEPDELPEPEDEPATASEKLRSVSDKVFGLFSGKHRDAEEPEAPAADEPETEDAPAGETEEKTKKKFFRTDLPELETRFGYSGTEYTSPDEAETIRAKYAADKRITDIRVVGTAALTLVLFIFDTFGKKFGGALSPVNYPAVQVLISLQLLFFAAALNYKRLWSGFCGIFTGKPNTYSIASTAFVFTLLYDVIIACMSRPGFTLYNFAASFTLLTVALRDHLLLAHETRNFGKIASWNSIYTLENADRIDSGDAKLKRTFRLHHGKFPGNYFAHTNRWDPSLKVVTILICTSIASALLAFIILLAKHENTGMELFNTLIAQLLFTLPAFAVVASIYPFYALMRRDRQTDCVVLSECDAQENAAVGTLVINEDDFFGKDGSIYVKQMNFSTAASGSIYDVLPAAYAILRTVGASAAAPIYKNIEKIQQDIPAVDRIVSVSDDGICGIVGKKKYFIGSEQYLTDNGIAPIAIDISNSGNACRRMHIATEKEDVVVYELGYSIKRRFANNLVKLANQGIKIVVRCTDPNIDEQLMRTLTGKIATPIKVRRNSADPAAFVTDNAGDLPDTVDGGILAGGDNLNDLIDRANICANYKKWSGQNLIWIGILYAVGIILAFLFALGGLFINMFSFILVIAQILALVPCAVISATRIFL